MGIESFLAPFIGPVLTKLFNIQPRVIVEWDLQPVTKANGWPAMTLEVTVHNRHPIPIYIDRVEVADAPFLNIWEGTHDRANRKSEDGYSVNLRDKVLPGGEAHLAFPLYPNWQAVWSDWSHPHSGDIGHMGGMVMRFRSLVYLSSKADVRLRSPLSRTHKIPAATVEANAAAAAKLEGDKAMFVR